MQRPCPPGCSLARKGDQDPQPLCPPPSPAGPEVVVAVASGPCDSSWTPRNWGGGVPLSQPWAREAEAAGARGSWEFCKAGRAQSCSWVPAHADLTGRLESCVPRCGHPRAPSLGLGHSWAAAGCLVGEGASVLSAGVHPPCGGRRWDLHRAFPWPSLSTACKLAARRIRARPERSSLKDPPAQLWTGAQARVPHPCPYPLWPGVSQPPETARGWIPLPTAQQEHCSPAAVPCTTPTLCHFQPGTGQTSRWCGEAASTLLRTARNLQETGLQT